jgi:hypothetical protein
VTCTHCNSFRADRDAHAVKLGEVQEWAAGVLRERDTLRKTLQEAIEEIELLLPISHEDAEPHQSGSIRRLQQYRAALRKFLPPEYTAQSVQA